MHRSIDTNISGVQDVIGWTFRNKALCAEALQMHQRSGIYLSFEGSDHWVSHNKRLELLGDTILDSVLCKKWIQARDANGNPHQPGDWTQMRHDLSTNSALGARGFELGLNEFIIKNHGTNVSSDMMANTLEAIIGAVFLDAEDQGFEAVQQVLEQMGFFEHPMLSLPNMEDSRSGGKKNSGVAYEKGPKALLTIT